jgi:hypothetical protein
MTKRLEVTVTIDDRKITLEGPEDFVRMEVQRLTAKQAASAPQPEVTAAASRGAGPEAAITSERDCVAQKMPHGHNETVAVLGYFLMKTGRSEFTAEDIRRAYIRAGIRPPKVPAQALRDAKNVNDYIERGSKAGTYKLTTFGERTVLFDLPRKRPKK